MGGCRFDEHGTCLEHWDAKEVGFGATKIKAGKPPALCTHAAQELVRRVEELEERLGLPEPMIGKMHEPCQLRIRDLESRLAQAEATVARMREALYDLWWWHCHADEPYPDDQAAKVRALLAGYDPRAALSPDAGQCKMN